ncbi:MAG TPA: toll/interleukin-1 receptor domain-containing protein [Ktedonobacteraceae bacterium]|nr:toll/interleukin-1 receptor domain-containing protein [Ktedonobacteraceae bacterium]
MADPNLMKILQQGSNAWNQWREDQSEDIQIDLNEAKLSGANLHRANLSGANLHDADLSNTNLSRINLSYAHLHYVRLNNAKLEQANLQGADLQQADLTGAYLGFANLNSANLCQTHLTRADLTHANLSSADLTLSDLGKTNLSFTQLAEADIGRAITYETTFAHVDLSQVRRLGEIEHQGPSSIALHSILLPQDGSALHFLRGCGVPDEWIDFYRATMMNPIQYHSCFISYSHRDDNLAHHLRSHLQDHGVRCWFATEDMKIGDKIRRRIDEAIHMHEKLLLLLSEHSLASEWVEDEVEAALEKERQQQREVIFPIRLDNAIMETSQAWAAKLRRQRYIGDFSNWTNPRAYEKAFERLLRDLKKAESQPA